MPSNNYRYFIYSSDQMNYQKDMADKMGLQYTVGRVIVGGTRKSFTSMSASNISPYSDAEVVAEGDYTKMKYTMPQSKSVKSRGNK